MLQPLDDGFRIDAGHCRARPLVSLHHDDHLSFVHEGRLEGAAEDAAMKGFEALCQLPRHDDTPRAELLREQHQCVGLEEHERELPAHLAQLLPLCPSSAGQKSKEGETVRNEAGPHERRDHRTRPGHHLNSKALRSDRVDDTPPWVADPRSPRVGDEADVVATPEALEDHRNSILLVVLVTRHQLGHGAKVLKERPRAACVLGKHERNRPQGVSSPGAHVPEVADGGRNDQQSTAHDVTSKAPRYS
jgi:hypothetical protein